MLTRSCRCVFDDNDDGDDEFVERSKHPWKSHAPLQTSMEKPCCILGQSSCRIEIDGPVDSYGLSNNFISQAGFGTTGAI